MKQYELTYLTSVNLPEGNLKALQEKINSFIVENEGALDEIKTPMKKELEYPIKKEAVVFMNTVIFHSNPEKLDAIEKGIRTENQIISHMFLIKKPLRFTEIRRRLPRPIEATSSVSSEEVLKPGKHEKPKKVEIKEIEKKLEEILGE